MCRANSFIRRWAVLKREGISRETDAWESRDSSHVSSSSIGSLEYTDSTSLWITCSFQSLTLCEVGQSFHTMYLVCTGIFRPPVGEVGNKELTQHPPSLFSKTPELHSQDLENLACGQVDAPQYLRKDFHFSNHNYGYYCLFL